MVIPIAPNDTSVKTPRRGRVPGNKRMPPAKNPADRLEDIAKRCTALGDRQNMVLHRHIGSLQALAGQLESITIDELASRLEDTVSKEENNV